MSDENPIAPTGRTMPGGRHFKVIREELYLVGPHAYKEGEDLMVTSKMFDALEDAEKRGECRALKGEP